MTCTFLSGADKLRYKQLNTDLNNNLIMRLDGYPKYLSGVIKLLKITLRRAGKIKTSVIPQENNREKYNLNRFQRRTEIKKSAR